MKRCPQCDRTYDDDAANYCLSDGAPLAISDSQPTVKIPGSTARKRSKVWIWVGLVVLIALVGIGGMAALLIYYFSGNGASVSWNRQNTVNASPSATPVATPSATATPTSTPTATVEPSPSIEVTKPSPNNDDANRITPITWNTPASGFKGDDGQIYKFQCPEKGTPETIWGSDVYTRDSSICTAAVHAGIISLDRGGLVTVEFRPGRSTYGSAVRNGITSYSFGEYPHSFVVRSVK